MSPKNRKIVIVRHGERVDHRFQDVWVADCFDSEGLKIILITSQWSILKFKCVLNLNFHFQRRKLHKTKFESAGPGTLAQKKGLPWNIYSGFSSHWNRTVASYPQGSRFTYSQDFEWWFWGLYLSLVEMRSNGYKHFERYIRIL